MFNALRKKKTHERRGKQFTDVTDYESRGEIFRRSVK